MSIEQAPYLDEILEQTCSNCPLRDLANEQIAEMAQGEDPYYFADTLATAFGTVAAREGVIAALDYVYSDLPFARDETGYAAPGLTEFTEESDAITAGQPNDCETVDRTGRIVRSVGETDWPPQPRALLACMRKVTASKCGK